MFLSDLVQIIKFIYKHPIQKKRKLAATIEFVKWQIGSRLLPHEIIYPFVDQTSIIVKKGMLGATGNVYTGLHEFEFMSFLLHFLRPADCFWDVGANIGSYTILSAGVIGAKTISVEPIAATAQHLKRNVQLNEIDNKVIIKNVGLGEQVGSLNFTKDKDTMNRVSVDENDIVECVEVQTADNLLELGYPTLIKIDVEGYEMQVLRGAGKTLMSESLQAIIIELNENSEHYNITAIEIENKLNNHGFFPYQYNGETRQLEKISNLSTRVGNTIFLKTSSLDDIDYRLKNSRTFSVRGINV